MENKRFCEVMSNVYICPLMSKNAPPLPEGIVKCAHLAPQKIRRGHQMILNDT